jgi:hypothetical protein
LDLSLSPSLPFEAVVRRTAVAIFDDGTDDNDGHNKNDGKVAARSLFFGCRHWSSLEEADAQFTLSLTPRQAIFAARMPPAGRPIRVV